jgi:hypothetical protein
MGASLIYHWRRSLLTAEAGGKLLQLPTRQTSASIHAWEKVQELRSGRITLWDHCFEVPHARIPGAAAAGTVIHRIGIEPSNAGKLEVYDYPGRYAQRFDGVDPAGRREPHRHPGTAVYVGGKRSGVHIHGWPPCNVGTCVVVMQQWEELYKALAAQQELRFSIDPS